MRLRRRSSRIPWTLRTLGFLAVAVAGFMVAAVSVDDGIERRDALADLGARLAGQAVLRGAAVTEVIDRLRRQVRFLAAVPPVQGLVRAALNGGFDAQEHIAGEFWEERLQTIFATFAAVNPALLQLRFIGVAHDGLELVRVDCIQIKCTVVPPDQLLAQGGSDYFLATRGLQPGEIHVSDLAFEPESGSGAAAGLPRLQATAPVFGPAGGLFGMVVLDIDGRSIIEPLQASPPDDLQLYLTNGDGDYLVHPQAGASDVAGLGRQHRWRDDFISTPQRVGEPPALLDFATRGGLVHAGTHVIPLNPEDPQRFLTVIAAASDAVVARRVGSSRRAILIELGLAGLFGGALVYLVLLVLRQQRRMKLSVDQMRLAAITESSNDAIIGKTLTGVVTDWNRAAERMFGYRAEEAIGHPLADLIVPLELRAEEVGILARIARGETVPHFNTRRCRRDGSTLDVAVTVSPLHGVDDGIAGASKTVRDISAETAALAALKEVQARLALTTQSNGIGLWEWDIARRVLTWDDTMFRLRDQRREDFPSAAEAWAASLHPENAEAVRSAFRDVLATDRPLDTTYRIITPKGEIRHIRSTGGIEYDEAGRPVRRLGTNFDITSDKEREGRIEELNATLEQQVLTRTGELQTLSALQRAILANAAHAFIATDLTGTITLFNPAAESMLGYRADELVGKTNPDRLFRRAEVARRAAELSAELGIPIATGMDVFVAIADRGRASSEEWTYIRKDGSRLPVLLWVSALRSDGGEIFGYLGIALDLSERRAHEQAILDRERFLKAITGSIPGGVSYWGADLRCRFANPAYLHWFGKSAEQVLGIELRELLGAERYRLSVPHIRAALDGEPQKFERRLVDADGRESYTWVQFIPDLQADEVRGFHVLTSDITELKEAQFRLESLNAALEQRTGEAEAATIVKGQFLANMSHEIRSPMNAILGMQQLLLGTELTARQRDYGTKAQSATRSLLRLLNDILDFSRMEAGKVELEYRPFSVEPMMRDLSGILSAQVDCKELELVFAIDPALPERLYGDEYRLRQILLNLVGNAIKFTRAGKVVVSIRRLAQGSGPVEIEFSVQDTGIGIAPAQLSAIFAEFSQAEASTSRRFGGTGLGLAISRRLVSLLGGSLAVESHQGAGSRFHFTLRLEEIEGGDPAATAAEPIFPAPPGRLRVLVVDDHDDAREAIVGLVEALGWQADGAATGEEALTLVDRSPAGVRYDAIFLDWLMPGLDGWETARRIRAMLPAAERPVVTMMSAHRREELAVRTQAEPALVDGFLVKPVTRSMLVDAIRGTSAGGESAAPGESVGVHAHRLAGIRLLVVDDNPINQQVARELLAKEGALVAVAGGGRSGVEIASAADPAFEAVLMDVQMPELDGYEATRMLRRRARTRALPVIAMTANAMETDKAACIAAGMNDHIAKPIDLDGMVATILRHCRPARAAEPAAPAVKLLNPTVAGGSDFAEALERLGDNKPLFVAIARRFGQESVEMAGAVERSLQAGEHRAAVAVLHTLRGLAGTVGVTAVAERAGRLEAELRENEPGGDMADAMRAFHSLLAAANVALATFAAGIDTPQKRQSGTVSCADPSAKDPGNTDRKTARRN
jgi:PAS domain S-box-containing protein